MPEHGNPNVRRRRLAAELRRLRERAGLIGEEVAGRLGWSTSKLSRIETSKSGIKLEDLRQLLELYRISEGHRAEVLALARESVGSGVLGAVRATLPGDYAEFLQAEAEAVSIWEWEPQVVPGLLQTESYARAVIGGWYSMFNLPPTELEIQVEARMARQQLLTRDQPPNLSAVIDESVIRRRFGDDTVMRGQLEWLAEASERPNVKVQILPLDGYHPIGAGTFVFMQFSQQHDVPFHDFVSIEQLDREYYIEGVTDTNKYRVAFERLRAEALGPAASHDLIIRTSREMWS